MAKLDLSTIPVRTGSGYPEPFCNQMGTRSSQRLGDAGGLTQFGVNLFRLEPGATSSMRHWHENEDEFVMVTEGTCTLVMDAGETELKTGDCAAFPAGTPDGHQIKNMTDAPACFLVVGTRAPHEIAHYSDIDMKVEISDGKALFTHRDGTPYPERSR